MVSFNHHWSSKCKYDYYGFMQLARFITCCFSCAILLTLATACDRNSNEVAPPQEKSTPAALSQTQDPVTRIAPGAETTPTHFNIGNKSYLFDVSDHTIEELESLLERAREISEMDMHEYPDLEIVMIIHGPDIEWFTPKNREKNHRLINLAGKLDEFDIIDMKVCKKTMEKHGVKREDIPAFMEPVPYAPDEIKRLLEAGFVNL